MTNSPTLVQADPLRSFVTELFSAAGCSKADAEQLADCLVQTNLWGIDSHGVLRVPLYLERMRNGAQNVTPDMQIIRQEGAVALIDADAGAGYLAATKAMNHAIETARTSMIAAVGVTNSNHCGAAALYARMAAEAGMVGIATTNVVPNMIAPGGTKPITGNNPMAFAVPTFGDFPFCLDISLSEVAGGKLLLAASKGEKIPLTWATDREGNPTDDPQKGFEGFLLPVGGHKGLGLSLFVDLLTGVITGGAFQHTLRGMYKHKAEPGRTGHMMIVLNPVALIGAEALEARMKDFVATLKASPMREPGAEMLLPGEIEFRTEQRRNKEGIALPSSLVDELREEASNAGITCPF